RQKVFKCSNTVRILLYRLLAGSNNGIQVQFIVTPSKPGDASSTTAQGLWRPTEANAHATHGRELKETTDGIV
ncbi:unnamed protein product, partial [Gulo gulo]